MSTPNDIAHQVVAKARRDHQASLSPVDISLQEVEHVLTYWTAEYGIEDLRTAIHLTEITLSNIVEEP